MAYLVSKQKVTITIAASSSSNTATISSVNTGRSFIVWGGIRSNAANLTMDVNLAYVELTNGTTVTATRAASGSNTVTVECYVIELAADAIDSIQRGTISLGSGVTTNTATITSVTTGNTVVTYLGNTSDRSGNVVYGYDFNVLDLTNSTTVTAAKGAAGSTNTTVVSYEVIEFASGVLSSLEKEYVTITGTNTSDTQSITSVDMDNAVLFYGGCTSGSINYTVSATRAELTASDTITFTRGIGTSATRYVMVQAVEFVTGFLNSVQRDTVDITSGSTIDDTITSVDTDLSVVHHLGLINISSTTFDEALLTVDLQSSTNVRGERGISTTLDAGLAYEAWEFAPSEGAGSAAISFTASGTGASDSEADASTAITITPSGAGAADSEATASASFTITPAGVGISDFEATGASAISFSVSGVGASVAESVGASSITFTVSGVGDSEGGITLDEADLELRTTLLNNGINNSIVETLKLKTTLI